jgi:protein-L-isoaspartate(D-aspartate) O-methyltransferase
MSEQSDERRRMVREQLARREIADPSVLEAMAAIPRERFVDDELQRLAYSDRALPIDCGQTISQPYMVALMTEALLLTGSERVLEIGTGSGYQTAVLARLAREVITVERHAELSRQAAARLADLGLTNVRYYVGDGAEGVPEEAPFDRILITAATDICPRPLWDQLAEGGLMVGPFGSWDEQWLEVISKQDGEPHRTPVTLCRFVPFVLSGEPPQRQDGPGARGRRSPDRER